MRRKKGEVRMDKNPTAGLRQADSEGGKFFNGFLLGLLVGAALVFLFGTKKGKKLLKAISEEGAENISNILEKADKSANLKDEELDEIVEKPSFTSLSPQASDGHGKPEGQGEFAVKETAIEEKPKVRRFFRGISRRVN